MHLGLNQKIIQERGRYFSKLRTQVSIYINCYRIGLSYLDFQKVPKLPRVTREHRYLRPLLSQRLL